MSGRLLRTTSGRPLVGAVGPARPLSEAPVGAPGGGPPPPPVSVAPPPGWVLALADDFPAGSALDRDKWAIVYGGGAPANGGAFVWDAEGAFVRPEGGLVLRVWNPGDGWHAGGVQQGNLAVNGHAGYGDFQVDVVAEIPAGQGVGCYAAMWPADDTAPPEFDLFETPGAAKRQILANWHWPPDGQAPRLYPVDATQRVLYLARRVGNVWRYWLNGVEQAVPPEWAQNPSAEGLVLGLAGFVAGPGDAWYGGPPDGTTPNPYEAVVHSVRLFVPPGGNQGGGGDPNPDAATVDAEYPAGPDTPVPPGPAGPLVRGQSNAGFYISEAIWIGNEGLAALVGVEAGQFDPRIPVAPGLLLSNYGLTQGNRTNPDIFTTFGGVPLWADGDAGAFLDATSAVDPAQWVRGFCGVAEALFVAQVMTALDRAGCHGVLFFHTENDSQGKGMADLDRHVAALKRMMELEREAFGRPATGTDGLPFFLVYPIPFGNNADGHRMIREAYRRVCADPSLNCHMVVAQTCDSLGGLRFGATERDYSHRDPPDLQMFARRMAFGAARVLNWQRGVGSRAFPSLGPKVVRAEAESVTSTLLTVVHDRGTRLRLGSAGAGDGRGWVVHDGGADRAVFGVQVVGSSQLRLSHEVCVQPVTQRAVSYCLYGQELGRDGGIYDNFSERPLPPEWPSSLGSEWVFDWPLRGFLAPLSYS